MEGNDKYYTHKEIEGISDLLSDEEKDQVNGVIKSHIRTKPFGIRNAILFGKEPYCIDYMYPGSELIRFRYERQNGLRWWHFRTIYRIIKLLLWYYKDSKPQTYLPGKHQTK